MSGIAFVRSYTSSGNVLPSINKVYKLWQNSTFVSSSLSKDPEGGCDWSTDGVYRGPKTRCVPTDDGQELSWPESSESQRSYTRPFSSVPPSTGKPERIKPTAIISLQAKSSVSSKD